MAKKIILNLILTAILLSLVSCNMIAGLGRDITNVAETGRKIVEK